VKDATCIRCRGPWSEHAVGIDPGFIHPDGTVLEKGVVVVIRRGAGDQPHLICQAVPAAYLDQDLDARWEQRPTQGKE
jgi:hypothetical protein